MVTANELLSMRADLAQLVPAHKWARAVRDAKLIDGPARAPFLVKGPSECDEDFAGRAKLTEYAPITPLVAARIDGACFKRTPTVTGAEVLDAFMGSASSTGESAAELVRRAVMDALWYRFAVILVDRRRLDPAVEAPRTQAQAEAAGVALPYGVVYPAPQVLDYRTDRMGKLDYIKLDGPSYTEGDKAVREVREVTSAGIQVYRIVSTGGGGTEVQTLPLVPLAPELQAAGILPIIPVSLDPIDGVMGRSPLAAALIAEKGAFHLLADIMWDLWLTGHPELVLKTARALSEIGIGSSRFLALKPDSDGSPKEDVRWLEAQLPGLAQQMKRYADARFEVQQQAGVRPIAEQEGAPAAESGAALSIRADSESYVLATISDLSAAVMWDLLRTVALDMGADVDPQVNYCKDYGLHSAERALALAQSFRALLGSKSAATKEAMRRAVMASLDNLSVELQAAIQAEIEAQGAAEPPAPNPFGGDDDSQ